MLCTLSFKKLIYEENKDLCSKFQSFNSNRKDWFPLSKDFFPPQPTKGVFGGSRGSISATHDENE
jgi:hypothetical protein